jgi:squalene synthase HpnC
MSAADDIRIGDILSGKSGSDENFPVASWLVAPLHRGVILGFYRFVRAADDIVDHATLTPAIKHDLIDRLEAGLTGLGPREPEAEPLRLALDARCMPPRHALDMLVAFRRDIDKPRTADWTDLIDYCRYSAMPVGRFVLDVHGESEDLWPANDALCAALQVINHLQDCARDYRDIGRVYLPDDLMECHGMELADLGRGRATPAVRAVLDDLVVRTHALLEESAGFAGSIRDLRLGLEVAVIQRVAEQLVTVLRERDPLADKVHLGRVGYVAAGLQGAATMGLGRLLRLGAPLPVARSTGGPRS